MSQNFKFENTKIEGLKLIHPLYAPDERGFFMKIYEKNIFEENGIFLENAEDMVSFSKKGVLRGIHMQTKNPQDKLIRVLRGKVWDVVVDLRKDSKTYLEWEGFTLSDENRCGLYVPSGFLHGFLALSDDVVFSYRCGKAYEPEFDGGVRWDDKQLNISWPVNEVEELIISDKDKNLPALEEFLRRNL